MRRRLICKDRLMDNIQCLKLLTVSDRAYRNVARIGTPRERYIQLTVGEDWRWQQHTDTLEALALGLVDCDAKSQSYRILVAIK